MSEDTHSWIARKPLREAIVLLLLLASAGQASAQGEHHRVLVLHSLRSTLPANTSWYDGIVRGLSSDAGVIVEFDIEAPDLSRFSDPAYVESVLSIYRQKYGKDQPDLIIPTYTPALRFLLQHGEELFPGVPVVFCSAGSRFVATVDLPARFTGVTGLHDVAGTLELILRLHPETRRLAMIVGTGGLGRAFESIAQEAVRPFADVVEFSWLRGVPPDDLAEAVAQLPPDAMILYLAQFEDRNGGLSVPVNSVKALSRAAGAPIYGLWEGLMGHGIVGGRLAMLEEDGYLAAQMGLRVLTGELPSSISIVDRERNPAVFDARELKRWKIDASLLPEGSRVLYRRASLWETYRWRILLTASALVLQTLLIIGLVLSRARLQTAQTALTDEHERRRLAETTSARQRSRLTAFSKERTLGALSSGIAHEVNQPLIAIQNYAQAALRRLYGPGDQRPKLVELLEKIDHQAGRAGGIIQRVRSLLSTDEVTPRPVLLYPVIRQLIEMMETDVEAEGFSIYLEAAADLPKALADPLEIQVVVVNLLRNAMQGLANADDPADRSICVEIVQSGELEQRISVVDRGPGLPPDKPELLFEPLHSEARGGMGIGLAMCQTIVQAHGGCIGYRPNPLGGAIFHFTLPTATADSDG